MGAIGRPRRVLFVEVPVTDADGETNEAGAGEPDPGAATLLSAAVVTGDALEGSDQVR